MRSTLEIPAEKFRGCPALRFKEFAMGVFIWTTKRTGNILAPRPSRNS